MCLTLSNLPLQDALEAVEDMREYDVPFHMRWAIDTGARCGWWYTVKATVRIFRVWDWRCHMHQHAFSCTVSSSRGP